MTLVVDAGTLGAVRGWGGDPNGLRVSIMSRLYALNLALSIPARVQQGTTFHGKSMGGDGNGSVG